MKLRTLTTAFLAGLLLAACSSVSKPGPDLSSSVGALNVSTSPSNVDPNTVYVSGFDGWGTSLAWFGNVVGGWSDTNRNAVADLIFGQNNLNFNIVRYNIGASPVPDNANLGAGHAIPAFLTASDVYDWSNDANQRWMLQAAKSRGANLFEAFSNSPPWWMTVSGKASGRDDCGDNLKDTEYDRFADYLTEVVKRARDNWSINFRTISPVNEPETNYWCGLGGTNNAQEGSAFSSANQARIIGKVGASLSSKGLGLTSVVAPDTTSVGGGVNAVNSYDATTMGYLSQLNTHTYGSSDGDQINWRTLGESKQKRVWMSEYGVGTSGKDQNSITSALFIANRVRSDLNVMKPHAWVYWQAAESDEYGSQRNDNGGLIWVSFTPGVENIKVTKSFYSFSNYSRFIRQGMDIIASGQDANTVAAYDRDGQRLVLVVNNNTTSAVSHAYDLSAFGSVPTTATPHRTSSSDNLAQLAAVPVSNKRLTVSVPANSVTTYVLNSVRDGDSSTVVVNDNTTGTGNNQFEYLSGWSYGGQTGAYQNDNHYTSGGGSSGASYRVRFNGRAIRVYGAKAPGHGIAALSIDGGPAVNVSLYSPTRTENALLWASPMLASEPHTLTVTQTGTKEPAASNTGIVVDRVAIVTALVLVNDNTLGSGTNQFEYLGNWSYAGQTGAYQNDNHYTGGGGASGASYKVRFSGRAIRVYGAKAPGHGIAAMSVDGAAPVNVSLYAPTRIENTLLWTSPTLAAGPHTLTVTQTGTKDSDASDTGIVADRVDIIP